LEKEIIRPIAKGMQCIHEEFAKYQRQTADQPTKEDAVP
jgi:hypothetical protein